MNPLLKIVTEKPELCDALYQFFLAQKAKQLNDISTRQMNNESLGQLVRGIDEGHSMIERAFAELRSSAATTSNINGPMPGR